MQRLDPNAFAAMLDNFAEPARYRNAFACPCVNRATGSPRANCPQCGGVGWLWSAPRDFNVAVASGSVQQTWARMGRYESGDTVVSIPHTSIAYQIAPFDRVLFLANADVKSEALTRGAPNERITGAVRSVDRVFWFDANGVPVEGSRPTVNADGTLAWPALGAPPPGQQYSITYQRLLEYFAFTQFANDRNKHGGLPLPKRMVLRRFDLLGRTPSPTTV